MTTDSETTTGGTQPSTSSLGGDTATPSSGNSNVTMTPAKLESFKKALHDIFRENREASHMEIPDVCFVCLNISYILTILVELEKIVIVLH